MDPNLWPEPLKLLEEISGYNTLQDTGEGKDFLNNTPFTQELRPTIDTWDVTKLQSFCAAKEEKMKAAEYERIFAS